MIIKFCCPSKSLKINNLFIKLLYMLTLVFLADPKVYKFYYLKPLFGFKKNKNSNQYSFAIASYLLCSPRKRICNSCNLISVILCRVPSIYEFWSSSQVSVWPLQPCTIPALQFCSAPLLGNVEPIPHSCRRGLFPLWSTCLPVYLACST